MRHEIHNNNDNNNNKNIMLKKKKGILCIQSKDLITIIPMFKKKKGGAKLKQKLAKMAYFFSFVLIPSLES